MVKAQNNAYSTAFKWNWTMSRLDARTQKNFKGEK